MAPIAYVPIAQNPSLLRVGVPSSFAPGAPLSGISAAIAQRVSSLNPGDAVEFVELRTQVRERLLANG